MADRRTLSSNVAKGYIIIKQGLSLPPSFRCNRRSNQTFVRQWKDKKQGAQCPSPFSHFCRGIEECCSNSAVSVGQSTEAKGALASANLVHQHSGKVNNGKNPRFLLF